MKKYITLLLIAFLTTANAQDFSGLNTHMGNLYHTSDAKSRSISPENFTGEKGKGGMAKLGEGAASHEARDLGQGWKVKISPQGKPSRSPRLKGRAVFSIFG